LFDKPDPDKCLGKIHNIYDIGESNNPFGTAAIVEFNRIEAEGKPSNRQDDDGKYITYVNIFQEPSGGDASEFVLKKGDQMTGELEIRHDQADGSINYDTPNLKAKHFRLSTRRADTSAVRHVQLYQPGYSTTLVCSGTFKAKGAIASDGTFYAGNPSGSDSNGYPPRMNLNATAGKLSWLTSGDRVEWDANGGTLKFDSNSRITWGSSGVSIRHSSREYIKTSSSSCTYFNTHYFRGHTYIGYGADARLYAHSSRGSNNSTTGTAGQVLTSGGSSYAPYWSTPSTGSSTTNYVKTNTTGFTNNLTITKTSNTYYITGG
jgi:hypothetical protein